MPKPPMFKSLSGDPRLEIKRKEEFFNNSSEER
jgi:hypothetical protein